MSDYRQQQEQEEEQQWIELQNLLANDKEWQELNNQLNSAKGQNNERTC